MQDSDSDSDSAKAYDNSEYHAQRMAKHAALAAKHSALADHHRRLHSNAIESEPRKGLMRAANRMLGPRENY